ncbi:sigma-54-dependent Fis family transcriptional regulator [Gammaproteobacteria bacterium 42_54_T18]|nr:sigma-54-dependent Fis family transcriptional regulator [Gammaproteobacteria bacterium 42_54_T18]
MQNTLVMVVEDDVNLREAIVDTLEMDDISVIEASDGEEALALLRQNNVSLVVSDVNMPRLDGYQLLRRMATEWPELPVLIMTAYGSISNAVEAIQNGAIDYMEKPFSTQTLLGTVRRHLPVEKPENSNDPVAADPETVRLFQLAKKVASTDSTVMIMGESGTGKEVLARFIHNNSSRSDKPFIAINCAAIPENMMEAILFGHEKGAFTGAHQSHAGKFELANGGTLLLDEISEMDVSLQAKLLRVLQEREVERIGGKKTISLDVRVLATTNRNLKESVEDGSFREDLFYRLNVFPLRWKPLRERKGDIVPLAERILLDKYSVSTAASKNGHMPSSWLLDEAAQRRLIAHQWPGNIRELDNVMQRAMILASGGVITEEDIFIPEDDLPFQTASKVSVGMAGANVSTMDGAPLHAVPAATGLGEDLKQREFEVIIETLKEEGGSKKNTASKLGISPRTLRYKLARMRESGIDFEVA